MKMPRALGWVVGGLLALVLLVVAVLYALFDEAAIKRQLVDQVAAKTGRQLAIAGELGLSVWPDVAVRVGELRLSEADGRTEFMQLGGARIGVAVLPLLSQRLEVRRIEIDGLAVNLVKRRDGSLNIDDLLQGKEGETPADRDAPAAAPTPAAPLRIDIAGLAVRDARLVWRDEAAGKTTEIADLDLSTGVLAGDLGRGDFTVEALALATEGRIGDDRFKLALEAPRLSLSDSQARGETLAVTFALTGHRRQVESRIALGGLSGSPAALAIRQFDLALDARLGESAIKAALSSPVAVDGKARTISLGQLAGSLEVSSPAMPMKQVKLPLSGRLGADYGRQRADLALATRLDASKIDLKLALERLAPLALGFALDIDQLDVDRYLPPPPADRSAAATPAKAKEAAAKAAAPEAKLDLSALRGFDVRGALRVGRLQAHRVKLSALDARVELAGGRLQVAPLRARLYGGTVDGSLAVNAGTNQFSVRQNLQGIDIAQLLKDLADKDILEGRGSLSVDVTTRGDSVPALKRGLAGQAALDLRDGAVKGVNVARLLREAKAALSGRQAVTGSASAAEKTDFSEMTGTFRIAGGVARNDDLSLKSPFLRLGGEGDIDIGRERIDYLAKVSVVDTATGQTGKDLASLRGITVPLRLRGPFDQIAYRLELDKLIEGAAKERIEKEKEKLKEKAGERLGKELQKLFGR